MVWWRERGGKRERIRDYGASERASSEAALGGDRPGWGAAGRGAAECRAQRASPGAVLARARLGWVSRGARRG
eukprot:192610-Chlamydomonas_euryale.AAC.1